jgi:hypothetical protein
MTEFEKALQECLRDLEQSNSNVDECLHRYPKYAQQLEPVLLTSAYLQRGREARPSVGFKARVRTRLIRQMYARPRRRPRSNFMFMRFAGSLAAVTLALLVAGTVYAQSALPGNAFYSWKLASEQVWRSVSPDPIGTDLAIAERRLNELITVSNDPALYSQALKAYIEVTDRLKSETSAENEARIVTVLNAQSQKLNQLDILPEQPDQGIIPQLDEPSPTPTPAATALPVLKTPQVDPTHLPEIIPTIQVPSPRVPVIQDPPKLVPTIEIPPPIP